MALRPPLHLAAALLTTLCAAPALAGPPAAIPEASQERAELSFDRFAKGWMVKMKKAERHGRSRPKAQGSGHVTYRGYGEDFRTELKPTGHAAAPFVGVLRYSEHLYSCSDAAATRCSVASTTPVTEIFRFQGGRWIY